MSYVDACELQGLHAWLLAMSTILTAAVKLAHQGMWAELKNLICENPELVALMDDAGRTLLIVCSGFGGSASIIQKLVAEGADVNQRAFNGSNAVAAAIVGGSRHGLTTLPELKMLLESGANPNDVADAGMPALHWAIAQHRLEHAKLLLDHGADTERFTEDSPPESVDEIAARIKSDEALQLLRRYRQQPSGGRRDLKS